MSNVEGLFYLSQAVPILCLGTHFVLAVGERNEPVLRFMLLGLGCLAPLAYCIFVAGLSPTELATIPLLVTFLIPGTWLILPATLGLGAAAVLRGRFPEAISVPLVVMSYLGVGANLLAGALLISSEM